MKTNMIKTAAAASVLLAFGGFGLFAQPLPIADESEAPKIERQAPEKHKRQEPPAENAELKTVTGKINVFSKDGMDFVSITTNTSKKKTYVLTVNSFVTAAYKNIPGNEENFKPEDEVTIRQIAQKKGEVVTLTGVLDREANVLTVIKSGSIPKPQMDNSNAK